MSTFIIDYLRPDGRKGFKIVEASTADQAVEVMQAAGIDGWTGYAFREYTILSVTERG